MNRGLAAVAAAALISTAVAWDAHGHRMITYLALDSLPGDMPAFLREAETRHRIAYQSNEADRWRGTRHPVMGHENNQDHYLDVELLEQFGLTLDSLPRLRNEYLRALIIAKHEHPEAIDPYDPAKDPDRSKEWPGAAPYSIIEHWVKLQSALQTWRILDKLDDPQRRHQQAQARSNVIYHMGMLSHVIGDLAQPLHTTRHFNGWDGPNPDGYTTAKTFHAYIDGGCIEHQKLTYADLKPLFRPRARVNPRDPWPDAIEYLRESHTKVIPLYRMEKAGELTGPAGRELLTGQLCSAADMLRAFYIAAWRSSGPNLKAEQDFLRYNNFKPDLLPQGDAPAAAADAAEPADSPDETDSDAGATAKDEAGAGQATP
ncbi:MAG: hypothetical protein IPM64_01820 [Phycisphaerales bacterium]|nr:hypothetical protein [Phycisphaerales bacterium]